DLADVLFAAQSLPQRLALTDLRRLRAQVDLPGQVVQGPGPPVLVREPLGAAQSLPNRRLQLRPVRKQPIDGLERAQEAVVTRGRIAGVVERSRVFHRFSD